jgi:nucleotide-binding universal stress UspA family protein
MKKTEAQETSHNKVILIPTDFSEACGNAISHGVKLAKSMGCTVRILHVINKETKAFLKKREAGVDYIEFRLKEYKRYYEKKYTVAIQTLAIEGSIFETINQVAKDIKATLMVLGTHGKIGLQHVFGSYALRVVIDSPVPVIVVQKRHFRSGYHHIVFPISNELEPRQKVQWAVTISRLFNSTIHLYRAKETDPVLNNRLDIITGQITKVMDEKAVPFTLTVAEKPANFAKQVLSYSSKSSADLIMIMTEPNYDVQGFSYSKWSEALMFNTAQMPVMCINPFNLGSYYYDITL